MIISCTMHFHSEKNKNYKRIKFTAKLALLFLLVCLLKRCSDKLFVADREFYTSPQGTNRIIVEYDHVCRPCVYQKTWYGKKCIWTYPGSGFMETVFFGVEWESEDRIRMIYDDINDEYDEDLLIRISRAARLWERLIEGNRKGDFLCRF